MSEASKAREEHVEERVLYEQPERLVMIKRQIRKTDGRYLIYYDFRREPAAAERPSLAAGE